MVCKRSMTASRAAASDLCVQIGLLGPSWWKAVCMHMFVHICADECAVCIRELSVPSVSFGGLREVRERVSERERGLELISMLLY